MQLILEFAEEKKKVKKELRDVIYRLNFCKPEDSEIPKFPSDFIAEKNDDWEQCMQGSGL